MLTQRSGSKSLLKTRQQRIDSLRCLKPAEAKKFAVAVTIDEDGDSCTTDPLELPSCRYLRSETLEKQQRDRRTPRHSSGSPSFPGLPGSASQSVSIPTSAADTFDTSSVADCFSHPTSRTHASVSTLQRGMDAATAAAAASEATPSTTTSTAAGRLLTRASLFTEDSPDVLLLFHQEAVYRQHIFPDCDNEFTIIVERAWNERELLQLESMAMIANYWLCSDEAGSRATIQHFSDDALQRIRLVEAQQAISHAETVARAVLYEELFTALDELQNSEIWSFLHYAYLAQAAELEVSRQLKEAVRIAGLPEIARPMTPVQPTAAAPRSRPGSSRSAAERVPSRPGSSSAHTPRANSSRPTSSSRPVRIPLASAPTGAAAQILPLRRPASAREALLLSFLSGGRPLMQFAIDAEDRVRQKLESCEEDEFSAIVSSIQRYRKSAPVCFAAISLEEQESAARRFHCGQYFAMLMEACSVFEQLHRRCIALVAYPDAWDSVVESEKADWLYARRCEVLRFNEEAVQSQEDDRKFRAKLFERELYLARQRRQFEQAEDDARVAVLMLERSAWRQLSAIEAEALPSARYCQLQFEKRAVTHVWTQNSYENVYLKESAERLAIGRDEHTEFMAMQSAEVAAYLATRRNALINDDVWAQLQQYDAHLVQK